VKALALLESGPPGGILSTTFLTVLAIKYLKLGKSKIKSHFGFKLNAEIRNLTRNIRKYLGGYIRYGIESENGYLRNLLGFMDYMIVFFMNSVAPSFAELHYFYATSVHIQ
jgi:hypothetical protein